MKKRCLTSTLVVTLASAAAASTPRRPMESQQTPNQEVSATLNALAQEAHLHIHARRAGEVTILDLKGRITQGKTSNSLLAMVKRMVKKGRNKILLNLGRVDAIDSNGIGALVSGYSTSVRQGGQLKLLNLTKNLQDLLAITKLLTVFDVYEDEATALESFVATTTGPADQRKISPAPTRSMPPRVSAPQGPSSQSELRNRIRQIIVDELGVDAQTVTPNARFINDLGADSLDAVELVMRCEEEFGIEIPDEDAEKLQRVKDVYEYIEKRTRPAAKQSR